jgi:starvation-inducible outer membrane lipoprotein
MSGCESDLCEKRRDNFMGKVLLPFLLLILTACATSPVAANTPTSVPTSSATTTAISARPASGKLTLVEFFAVT